MKGWILNEEKLNNKTLGYRSTHKNGISNEKEIPFYYNPNEG